MSNLNGKVIIVTGSSRGIGATIATQLAAAGANVIVNYAGGQAAAEQVVADITAAGGNAIAVQADVSKPTDAEKLFDAAIDKYGKVDVLLNNAGIMIIKPLKDTTDEDFDRQFAINVKGTFNTLRIAATRLADNGTIINFATSVSRLMVPGYATYGATKAAVEQFTRVFAKELGPRGINVNTVSPGPTNTELFTNGKSEETIQRLAAQSAFNRIGDPDDIAKVVTFLVSDDAKWISGQNIGVNGAMA
ncbi:SDR family oxidoreductase [Chitinophaga pendula]|uniref:SDR family oxidoreductase n=1 Tax=Chitinophaga TaxID=79328 RepID=UPI000BAF7C10|nr:MULTISPECIES: SDR family oxidoreductase [Chitinophaga]ASZ13834.1 3-ketoacyl-ACP reductase [Chitinophaga sp. MD30]UCJ08543.1 SDR family oxidoreductase [Chitinophaga pendula]